MVVRVVEAVKVVEVVVTVVVRVVEAVKVVEVVVTVVVREAVKVFANC